MFREPVSDLVYCYNMAESLWYQMRAEQAPLRGTVDDLPHWRQNGTSARPPSLSSPFRPSNRSSRTRRPKVMRKASVESLVASVGSPEDELEDMQEPRIVAPREHGYARNIISHPMAPRTETDKQITINDLPPLTRTRAHDHPTKSCVAEPRSPFSRVQTKRCRDGKAVKRHSDKLSGTNQCQQGGSTPGGGRCRASSRSKTRAQSRQINTRRRRDTTDSELRMSCYLVLKQIKEDEVLKGPRPMPERPVLTRREAMEEKCRWVKRRIGELCKNIKNRNI